MYIQNAAYNGVFTTTCNFGDFRDLDVTVYAKDVSPFTTSDKAGGNFY